MNLRQAYDGWSQQEQNRQLYVNTRDAFRRAWFTLPTNKPCSWYTKDVLALALAETRVVESDKVKSASVMLHVLTWANFAEPKYNPKPDFEIKDVTRLIHLPADKLEKERQRIMAAQQAMPEAEEPTDEEETDLDIDPVTALPRRAMADEDNKATATEEPAATPDNDADPVEGIEFPDDNDEPKEDTNMEQKRPRGKPPKPVAQIHPETLEVVRVWPSRGAAESELGASNLDRCIAKLRKSVGFYWSDPKDADAFADRLKQKQNSVRGSEVNKTAAKAKKEAEKKRTGRPSTTKAEKKPKTKKEHKGLTEQFAEEYEQFKEHQAAGRPDSPQFHIGDRVCNMLPQFAGMVGTVITEGAWDSRTYIYEVQIQHSVWKMLESEMMPSAAVQVAVTDDPTPSTVTEHQPAVTEQPSTPSTLADFTDDELMEELDRRGFEGELSRRVVFTIGK